MQILWKQHLLFIWGLQVADHGPDPTELSSGPGWFGTFLQNVHILPAHVLPPLWSSVKRDTASLTFMVRVLK